MRMIRIHWTLLAGFALVVVIAGSAVWHNENMLQSSGAYEDGEPAEVENPVFPLKNAAFQNAMMTATTVTFKYAIDTEDAPADIVVSDADAVKDLVANIKFIENEPWEYCFCVGYYIMEFSAGKKLLARFHIMTPQSLRWLDKWPENASLTAGSANYLHDWLQQRGGPNLNEVYSD